MKTPSCVGLALLVAVWGCDDAFEIDTSSSGGAGGSCATSCGGQDAASGGAGGSPATNGGNGGSTTSVGGGASGGGGGDPWTGVPTDRPLRLLFLGNSFTQQGPVPDLVRDVATSAGWPSPAVNSNAPGGTTLAQHQGFTESVDLVDAGGWDFVVLEEFSTRPTDNIGEPEAFKNSATWFYDRAKMASPDAHIILYETWARHPDHGFYPNTFANPAEMQTQLRFHYNDAANNFIPNNSTSLIGTDVTVSPVGDTWEHHLAGAAPLRLHGSDDYHAGTNGRYLNAVVLYSTIYGVVANGVSNLGLDVGDAEQLQLAADAITGNTLEPPFEKPTLAVGRSVRVDFGSVATSASGWNTIGDCVGGSASLIDDLDQLTGVDVRISDAFTGANDGGLAANLLGYPGDVSSDVCWTGSFDGHTEALLETGSITLSQVEPGNYELTLFASRTGTDNGNGRLTRYSVAGQTMDVECSDNVSNAAIFANISPDPQGNIVLDVQVSPGGTSRFAYLGALLLRKITN